MASWSARPFADQKTSSAAQPPSPSVRNVHDLHEREGVYDTERQMHDPHGCAPGHTWYPTSICFITGATDIATFSPCMSRMSHSSDGEAMAHLQHKANTALVSASSVERDMVAAVLRAMIWPLLCCAHE